MAILRMGMGVAAAATVLIGVIGCSVSADGDSAPAAPNQVEPVPDRIVRLEVGTVIHPDGTVEYRGSNVPIDVSTLLEAPTGQ
jgi:hypothetical protein